MIVNVCCSGSSGSTLLSSILNRHPDIFAGEELGIFSKPVCYERFSLMKRNAFLISRYGVSSSPYFEDRSILRNLETYGLKKKEVWDLLKNSESFIEFISNFKKHVVGNNKRVWVEKTPENIFMIKYFLKEFPRGKVIHIVRDPRDVILSLMNRGVEKQVAAEVWLSSVASIQPFINNNSVLEVKYEDLVLKPSEALKEICGFVGVSFQESMIKAQSSGEIRNSFDTWKNNPNAGISTSSIGKYIQSDITFDDVFSMKVTKSFAKLQGIEEFYLIDMMKRYDYDITGVDFQHFKNRSKKELRPHKSNRFLGRLVDYIMGYAYSYARVEL